MAANIRYYKKCILKAFTLSEVLITLTVIGVIAILTVPALIQNMQQQIMIARLKEGAALITQATRQIATDNGGTLVGTFNNASDAPTAIRNNYEKYLSYIKNCNNNVGTCWPSSIYNLNGGNGWYPGGGDRLFVLSNGIGIAIDDGHTVNGCDTDWNSLFKTDNVCYQLRLSINGINGSRYYGKDLFVFWVLADGTVIPYGTPAKDYSNPTTDCSSSGTGLSCTALYLRQ